MNLENDRNYSDKETGFIAPPDAKPANPETQETNAHFHEKKFSGTVEEILAQIKTEINKTGRMATSAITEKTNENDTIGTARAMFENIKCMRKLNKNQAS